MNEQIKQLAEQVGGVRNHGYERGEPIERFIFSVDGLEKFAELIIKECIDLVEYNSHGAAKDIKEHFGVTE